MNGFRSERSLEGSPSIETKKVPVFQTRHETSVRVEVDTMVDALWYVDLFNDDIHTFEEVITQLMKATACTQGKAEDLAWTVHREGKAPVFEGDLPGCLRVVSVLGEIGLVTQIKG
jgi:ATP-dependent Clp protease adaptor protein ClpS